MSCKKPGWTKEYAAVIMNRLETNVFPEIGIIPINSIEAPKLLDALRKVESRGVIEVAHRLKTYMGQIFRFAIVTGRARRDPSADLKGALKAKPAEPRHHKPMPRRELPAFLRAVEKYDGDRKTSLALRLIVLTFVRTNELRAGRWNELEEFDGSQPLWRIPQERMKKRREHLVPLSPRRSRLCANCAN